MSIAVFWTTNGYGPEKRRCDLRVNTLSTISVVAKPRTAIVINIIVAVGICARNSINFHLPGDLGHTLNGQPGTH